MADDKMNRGPPDSRVDDQRITRVLIQELEQGLSRLEGAILPFA